MTFADACEHLRYVINTDGGLYSLGWYLAWDKGYSSAILDGEFTSMDLEAIAVYMRGEP